VKVGVSREIIVPSASGERGKETRSGRTQRKRKREKESPPSLSLSLSVFLRSPFDPSKVPRDSARYLDTVPVSARPNGCLLGASPYRSNVHLIAKVNVRPRATRGADSSARIFSPAHLRASFAPSRRKAGATCSSRRCRCVHVIRDSGIQDPRARRPRARDLDIRDAPSSRRLKRANERYRI